MAGPLTGRPIIEMFWLVEYDNGRSLAQFDPATGRENRFEWVNHKIVKRIAWLPISAALAQHISGARHNPRLKPYVIETRGGKGFVARRNAIRITMGKVSQEEKARALLRSVAGLDQRSHRVSCYIIGIEGLHKWLIYPDGHVEYQPEPKIGESQDILHHG